MLKTVLLFNMILFEEYKEQHLFETEICCNIIHDFNATSDQLNAFLRNEK